MHVKYTDHHLNIVTETPIKSMWTVAEGAEDLMEEVKAEGDQDVQEDLKEERKAEREEASRKK